MTQQLLFQRDLLIDAPLTHVWQLVATEEGLRQWWGNPIFLEAKEGGRCEEWRPGRHKSSHWRGVVTLYAPPDQLMLTLRAQNEQHETQQDAQEQGPECTTIAIALTAVGEQTRVHVTQRAFGPTPAIASQDPNVVHKQPEWRQNVPLAQLTQPAPGALPMPNLSSTPGNIEPSQIFVNQTQLSALSQVWQIRFTSLVAATQTSQP